MVTQPCTHKNVIPGLDAAYCPGCGKSFESWTAEYQLLTGCVAYGQQPKEVIQPKKRRRKK